MKRSTAVDKLHEWLWNNYHDLDANNLMEIIEKELKMQPPNITLAELIPGHGFRPGEVHYYACWEPEDEEN